MKQRIHDALLGLVGIAGIAFFALSGASCESPTMQCAAGHGAFFLKYTLTSGDADCYGLTGEEVGFSTYLTVEGRKEIKDATGKVIAVQADSANYNVRNIAVQSTTMGATYRKYVPINTVPPDGSGSPYAFGAYTSNPDASDICYAGGASGTAALSTAEINFPDKMVNYRQSWTDLEMFVTTNVPGTQAKGKMKFEDVVNNCSAEYTFYGLYPAIPCGDDVYGQVDNDMDPATPVDNDTNDDKDDATPVGNDKDDDGDDTTPVENDKDDDNDPATPVTDDDGTPGPDVDVDADEEEYIRTDPNDLYCDPKGDSTTGRLGSGINPDFTTVCDTVDFYCVLKPGTELIK